MSLSGNPAGTHPAADVTVSKAYLVPTPAGAWYAASGNRDPSRSALLLTLLRGGTGFPISLDAIMQWTGLTERKAIAGLLFALQREGLLTSDATPLAPPQGSITSLLTQLLESLGNGSTVVLAEPAGFCVAYARTSQERAELLAARVASLDPRLRRLADDGECWSLGDEQSETRLSVRRIHFPHHRFLLISSASADLHSEGIVQLLSVLARYCLGAVTLTKPEGSSSP